MKKIVRFDPKQTLQLALGVSALIVPIDHPDSANVSNKGPVLTSTVLKISPNGAFETLNTQYCPVHVEDMSNDYDGADEV